MSGATSSKTGRYTCGRLTHLQTRSFSVSRLSNSSHLRKLSKFPVVYAELPGAQHAFDIFGSPRAHHAADMVGQFLSWVYATRRSTAR
jgi:hypothetical protein